jgi:hypothetical protein
LNHDERRGLAIGQRAVFKRLRDEGIVGPIPHAYGPGAAGLDRDALVQELLSRSQGHYRKGLTDGIQLVERWLRAKHKPQCAGRLCRDLSAVNPRLLVRLRRLGRSRGTTALRVRGS